MTITHELNRRVILKSLAGMTAALMAPRLFSHRLLLGVFLGVLVGCSKSGPIDLAQVTAPNTRRQNPFENTLGMKFVAVPGTGVLFSIWDTRVQDYQAFVLATSTKWPRVEFEQGPTHPAVNVSWLEAGMFCQWLTLKERSEGRIGPGQEYRLPTDVEWSAAAGLPAEGEGTPAEKSGRINSAYPWGTLWPPPNRAGNYCDLEFFRKYELQYELKSDSFIHGYDDGYPDTSPVGSFNANQFGLYDMGGNVWQWCEDWYDNSRTDRVLRGASFTAVDPNRIALAFRYHLKPENRYVNYGFRCVLARFQRQGEKPGAAE